MWNELVRVINNESINDNDRDMAQRLLRQLNTAGGRHLMRKEITYFLEDMVDKYGTIPTKISLEEELAQMVAEMEKFKAYWANKPKLRDDIIMVSNRMHKYFIDIENLRKKIAKFN